MSRESKYLLETSSKTAVDNHANVVVVVVVDAWSSREAQRALRQGQHR
jgi:hypothetical protein